MFQKIRFCCRNRRISITNSVLEWIWPAVFLVSLLFWQKQQQEAIRDKKKNNPPIRRLDSSSDSAAAAASYCCRSSLKEKKTQEKKWQKKGIQKRKVRTTGSNGERRGVWGDWIPVLCLLQVQLQHGFVRLDAVLCAGTQADGRRNLFKSCCNGKDGPRRTEEEEAPSSILLPLLPWLLWVFFFFFLGCRGSSSSSCCCCCFRSSRVNRGGCRGW